MVSNQLQEVLPLARLLLDVMKLSKAEPRNGDVSPCHECKGKITFHSDSFSWKHNDPKHDQIKHAAAPKPKGWYTPYQSVKGIYNRP